MRKAEFLEELKAALEGSVPDSVLWENIRYYDQYISQETASGRREEDVTEEIGSPRLIAKTIIDSSEAAGYRAGEESSRSYQDSDRAGGPVPPRRPEGSVHFHQIDLNKWYWKVLFLLIVVFVFSIVFFVVGGIFSLLIRLAGPILLIWLIYVLIRGMWR